MAEQRAFHERLELHEGISLIVKKNPRLYQGYSRKTSTGNSTWLNRSLRFHAQPCDICNSSKAFFKHARFLPRFKMSFPQPLSIIIPVSH